MDAGIPGREIAIRTADVNELKDVDLMRSDCPIRYIITVNALKEGWDCPFAYILASLANRTSQIDVEQILGRILRLPYTRENEAPALNMSYVLTSSNDFKSTLDGIIRGLNSAGFSERDCREAILEEPIPKQDNPSPVQQTIEPISTQPEHLDHASVEDESEDFLNFDPKAVSTALSQEQEHDHTQSHADRMIAAANETSRAYVQSLQKQNNDPFMQNISQEVRDKVPTFPMVSEFSEEAMALRIPQFFCRVPKSIFTDGGFEFLDREMLSEGFTLKGKATDIDFSSTDSEMAMVDVSDATDSSPKAFKMSDAYQQYFKEYLSRLPTKERIAKDKDLMLHQLSQWLNMVDDGELRRYVGIIVEDMTEGQLSAMEKSPTAFARKIREKIEMLLEEHYAAQFDLWLETGKIFCREFYSLPEQIHPTSSTSTFAHSLYKAEEEMNGLERDLVMELTARSNVKWWHRNISRQGFVINGFINHYPDLMIMTKNGHLILAEAKGKHLKNDDSLLKTKLGRAWQKAAGDRYRYYMVFRDSDSWVDGAVSMSKFLEILKNL